MHPKLDVTRQNAVCAILAIGGTRKVAAHYVGCTVRTIRNTAKRDPVFAERLRRTEVGPELTYLKTLDEAARDPKSWRATRWMMERLYPHRYAPAPNKSFSQDEVRAIITQFIQQMQRTFPKGSPERQRIRSGLKELAESFVARRPKRRRKSTTGQPAGQEGGADGK